LYNSLVFHDFLQENEAGIKPKSGNFSQWSAYSTANVQNLQQEVKQASKLVYVSLSRSDVA
jgi:hypothetical protein